MIYSEKLLKINHRQFKCKKVFSEKLNFVDKSKGYTKRLAIDTRKPIELVKSRRIEEIREVIVKWGSQILEQIVEVSIDLWSLYKSLVEELMPNANITADRFHVMKQVNDEFRCYA